jgi:hypothetical protein
MLSSHLRLGLPSGLLPLGLPTKNSSELYTTFFWKGTWIELLGSLRLTWEDINRTELMVIGYGDVR